MVCDSIDDLGTIGGKTSKFRMLVYWRKDYLQDTLEFWPDDRAELWFSGSAKRQSWATDQVYQLFKRRIDWTGKFRWLVISVAVVLWLLIYEAVDHYIHKFLGREGAYHWFAVLGLGSLLGYPAYRLWARCVRSAVILQRYRDEKGSWFERHRDQITLAAVTSLISAIIGAVIALAVQKVLR